MTNDSETCDAELPRGGTCDNHTVENGGDPDRCWIPTHNDEDAENPNGRPRALDDERTRQRVLVAVGQGLKVKDQASLAGIAAKTLRRGLCCIDSPRDPNLDPDPCDFCRDYAQARANGAREVLNDCRPEFIASASFGYVKEEKQQITGDDGGPLEVNLNETIVNTSYSDE